MYIANGHLIRDGSVHTFFGLTAPYLAYALTCEDGKPATGDHFGRGIDQGNRVVLGDPQNPESHLTFYTVAAEPTPESLAYLEGWLLALRQPRRTEPRDEQLREGWHAGYLAVQGLSAEQRRARRRAIREAGPGADHAAFVRALPLF